MEALDDQPVTDIFAFIDCNCLETCSVGRGPRNEGPDSDRWEDVIQRAFYNGWKSVHGLKHQIVDIAHGFTIDMYGPTSLRRNNLVLLRESNINHRVPILQIGEPDMQLKIFGGSIYPHLSHVYAYRKGQNLTEAQRAFNHKSEGYSNRNRMELRGHR